MALYRQIFLLLIIVCVITKPLLHAQTPVIIPKPGPITLKLDATGNYSVKVSDLADITGTYTSAIVTPSGLNCTTLGPQSLTVTATNDPGIDPISTLNYPYGIVSDAAGNIYIADSNNNDIKKVTPAGMVTLYAGTGTIGSADGSANSASFNRPWGLAIDAVGNIFVADSDNNKIRKIDQNGIVSTFAGNGLYSSLDGKGAAAGFYNPHGIAIDGTGYLYITDGNNRIRKISPDANVSTLAGNTSGNKDGTGIAASFYFPIGIAVDAAENLYIADNGNNEIRKITAGGTVTTIAGNGTIGSSDGTGKSAIFNAPTGITLDATGNLYITEGPDNKIRKIVGQSDVSTVHLTGTGSGSATSVSKTINVTVVSQPLITKPDTIIIAYNNCFVTLPDYTKNTVTADNCPGSVITLTQVPLSGMLLNPGVSIPVMLNATDASGGTSSILFNVTVVNSDAQELSFNGNLSIVEGNGIKLIPVINSAPATYSWSPVIGLNDPSDITPTANPRITTTYTLTVTSLGGCTSSASITVTVIQPIAIPNTFSPNGDGINDIWNIAHLNDHANCTVDVFNRNGQLLFHSIGYSKPWNGTINGHYLPSGPYYYVIDLKDGTKKRSGEVTILH